MKDFDPNSQLLQLYPNAINVFEFTLEFKNFPFDAPVVTPVGFPDFTLEEITSYQWTPVMSILDYLKAIKKNLPKLGHFDGQNPKLRRVLIVDSNVINLKILHDNLSRIGHICTVTTNGYEAIQLASNEVYSAIIIEFSLPLMNGLETALTIKESYLNNDNEALIFLLGSPDALPSSALNCIKGWSKPIYLSTLKSLLLFNPISWPKEVLTELFETLKI
eukprot:TRINITY_DN572_c0_g1_i7.p1 TRINITY_DN572_c0_g1~~TRINITY_DN572_c0_g1_i7.p1  ORF type:complete len:219 (+),score=43.74 TRINITY_DN572_c0_g1_i7:297-953(+)